MGPLSGVTVIDLTGVVMGPYATQILADMGADVIKVESTEGDVFRYTAPAINAGMSAAYMQLNRNKRSIVLNLKDIEDLTTLKKLLINADVLITNIRPQAMRRLGLAFEDLKQDFPKLIYCAVYGFSEQGPYAGRPAFDDLIQAMSGIANLQGRNKKTYVPEYTNSIIADKITGLTATYAISMALYEREKSGLGQAIDIPMFETMVAFNLAEHMAEATFCDNQQPTMGYGRVLAPARKPYQTKNGFIAMLPYTTEQWRRFFSLSGHTQYTKLDKFMDPVQRGQNISELYDILESIVKERTTEEWLHLLSEADIPVAKVNSLEQLLQDEQLVTEKFFQYQQHPTEGKIRMCGIPVCFSRTPGSIHSAAPNLGQDTETIKKAVEHLHLKEKR